MGVLGGHDASKVQVMDFSLRLLLIPFNVATIWITVTTKQDNSTYGTLRFNNLVGLKYMVCISAVSTGYALLAAVTTRLRWLVTKPWLFFVIDQVQIIAYLMVTSMAAQGEFLDLAFNGARAVTWSQACASYGKLCSRLIMALALHVVAVCCFLLLAVISAYRVFKRFEPPSDLPDKEPHPLQ